MAVTIDKKTKLDWTSIKNLERKCMTEKDFTSVEEMDKFFETNKVESEPTSDEETQEEPEVVDEVPDLEEPEENEEEESEETTEEEEEDEEEVEPEPQKKPSKEEKRDYAFSKLRKEKDEAKKAYEEQNALVQRLMREAGYNDYASFKDAVDKQFSEKEMKDKGYTKEQYNEVEELRKHNKELEEKLEATNRQQIANKAQGFDTLVKSYAGQYKTTAKEIYDALDNSGFTAEMLLNLPNPEVLIRGVLADKVKPVEKPAKKAVDTEKLPSGSTKKEFNLDELLQEDFAEYKKRKGLA